MSKHMYISDSHFTSVSQRKENVTPVNDIIMPILPKINMCQTNWQSEDPSIIQSKMSDYTIQKASPSKSKDLVNSRNDEMRILMPPPSRDVSKTMNEVEYFVWTPYLNKNLQIAVKGQTKNGFIHGRSVQKRLSNFELIDKGNKIQKLRGPIFTNNADLPPYVVEKFQNGFPKDWKIIAFVWADYVRLHKPTHFRWPQPVSDSNEDIPNDSHSDNSEADDDCDTIVENVEETVAQNLNDTYNLNGNKSPNPIKIISNVLLTNLNSVQNTIQQSQLKRPLSTGESSEVKKRKIGEYFDTIFTTLNKLKEDILGVSDEACQDTQTMSKSYVDKESQTNFHDKQTEKSVVIENISNIPSSPEYMGIPRGTKLRLRPTRSFFMNKREIRKRKKSSENINPEKNNSNISYDLKRNLDKNDSENIYNGLLSYSQKNQNKQSTPKTVNEVVDENVLECMDNSIMSYVPSNNSKTLVQEPEKSSCNQNIEIQTLCLHSLTTPNLENVLKKHYKVTPLTNLSETNFTKICKKLQQSDSGFVTAPIIRNNSNDTQNISRQTINISSSSSDGDNIFPSTTQRQMITDNTIANSNQNSETTTKDVVGTHVSNKQNENVIESSAQIEVSKRGRVRCRPLNYWEGHTLENIVKNKDKQDFKSPKMVQEKIEARTKRKTTKENKLHPAIDQKERYPMNSTNGRVKLFNRQSRYAELSHEEFQNEIDSIVIEHNLSIPASDFTEIY